MTKEELISQGKTKVRRTPSLLLLYIDLYQQQFGRKPNCASCTFNSDWARFISDKPSRVRSSVKAEETPKTFKLKTIGSDMFRFSAHGKTYRKYSNRLTEEFAINFLTYGTETEIEQRKKLFDVLPEKLR